LDKLSISKIKKFIGMEKGKKNITPNAEHMDGGGIKIVTGNWGTQKKQKYCSDDERPKLP
jgi:hypothetical protein